MRKIKRGDEVIVITGRDKGKRGQVVRMAGAEKLVVEGINVVKKHVKPNPTQGQPGGILEREMPLQVSNVAYYNKATERADRIGFRVLEDGRKVRFTKSNGEVID
ncbi:MAG: 50S ribosomal protein L24 [Immundisolibacter sp.]|jgi:large subunit ribosomal protein L24|uniref:50S ribosomal protein L24 n=1 Tax=Immundisolibacter sp. TaxID=1934948 RepID=UPI003569FF70